MSAETRARLAKASQDYIEGRPVWDGVVAELADAIVAERREGTLIEDLTALVPYRQTHVNRILARAGLTTKRAKPGTEAG